MSIVGFLMNVAKWPLNAYHQVTQTQYIPTIAAVGVAYYVYGNPADAADVNTLLMQYALAGAVNTALAMSESAKGSAMYGPADSPQYM